MKNSLIKKLMCLLFVFSIGISQQANAQVDSIEYESFNRVLFEVWGHLDTATINTGLLIDRFGYGESNTVFQNGSLNDSVTDFLNWLLFYNAIRFAGPDTIYPMKKETVLAKFADSIMWNTEAIPLGMLYYNYNKLKDSAFVDNLVYLDDNHKLMDNFNRSESPYHERKVFSICPLVLKSSSLDCNFNFNTNLSFTNHDSLFSKLEFKFNNDSNWVKFYSNQNFVYNFQYYGTQIIMIRAITANGDTLYCKSKLELIDENEGGRSASCSNLISPDLETWIAYPTMNNLYPSYPLYDGKSSVLGLVATWLGCVRPNQPPKPILFVAGFNPKNSKTINCYSIDNLFQSNGAPQSWNSIGGNIWRGTYFDTFNGAFWPDFRGLGRDWAFSMQNNETDFLQTLRELGFDVWILVMADGTDRIENNAVVVINTIKHINDFYDNSSTPKDELIISSYSAGAISARYALAMMEKDHFDHLGTPQSNLYPHHRVKNWLSFEGEYYGANTPIGFQYFANAGANTFPATIPGLINQGIFTETDEIISSPSGKQLSRYAVGAGSGYTAETIQLRQHFELLNPNNRGYPEWCRKVSVSQGSGVGVNVLNPTNYTFELLPSAPMFDYEEHSPTAGLSPYRKIKTWWNNDGTSMVAWVKTGVEILLLGVPIADVSGTTEIIIGNNYMGWDYCPGSALASTNMMFDNCRHFTDLHFFSHFNYSHTIHSFAPTVGTFDLRTPESNYQDEENVFCDIDNKYDLFQIRKNQQNQPFHSDGHRFGYPHLADPINHRKITPFDGVASVPDPELYQTILPNHFHVDDLQPDFLEFLTQEIAPYNIFIQNRDIGNLSPAYKAAFHAQGKIYCGKKVMQDFSDYWQEPVGEVLVDQGTKTLMTGTEIIFRTGVSVVGGGGLHAKLNIIGPCTDDLSGRYNNAGQNNGSEQTAPISQNNNFDVKTEGEGFSITISPNPINAKEQKLNVRLREIEFAQFQLIDLLGKEIFKSILTGGNNLIQLPEDAKGIYILKIIFNDGSHESKKLLIQ